MFSCTGDNDRRFIFELSLTFVLTTFLETVFKLLGVASVGRLLLGSLLLAGTTGMSLKGT